MKYIRRVRHISWFLTLVLGLCLGVLLVLAGPAASASWGEGRGAPPAPSPVAWAPTANLSKTAGSSYSPRLVADSGGTLHLLWSDWEDLQPHWPYIFYAVQPPGGGWSQPVKLPGAQGSMPVLAAGSDGSLHAAWAGSAGIEYAYKPAGGNWSARQLLGPGGNYPGLAAGPDHYVHLAWIESSEVKYRSRNPNGTWNSVLSLYTGTSLVNTMAAVTSQNVVYVVFNSSGNTIYRYREANGSWNPNSYSPGFNAFLYIPGQLAGGSSGVHLAWGAPNDDNTICQVFHASQVQPELQWSTPYMVSEQSCYKFSWGVSLALDANGLAHVAWQAGSWPSSKAAWYAYQRPVDLQWSTPSRVNKGPADGPWHNGDNTLSLAVVGSLHHLAWDSGPVYVPPDQYGGLRGEIWYTSLDGKPPVTRKIPAAGGKLLSASADAGLDFPPGAVVTDTFVTLAPIPPFYAGNIVVRTGRTAAPGFALAAFELSAARVSDEMAVNAFAQPVSLALTYTDPGPTLEDTLGLYFWNGAAWEAETGILDEEANRLDTFINQAGVYILAGTTRAVYLPVILR